MRAVAAEGLALEALPSEREFYEEATSGRRAFITSRLERPSLLYHVLVPQIRSPRCAAPKFAPEKTEPRCHTFAMGERVRNYASLTYHLVLALFFNGCRIHELARLTMQSTG